MSNLECEEAIRQICEILNLDPTNLSRTQELRLMLYLTSLVNVYKNK